MMMTDYRRLDGLMALAIYHVTGTAKQWDSDEHAVIGVCADGKTEAARIVRARILSDGYSGFTHIKTERIAPAGKWEPGTTIRY